MKKYYVELTASQRQELEGLVSHGSAPARAIMHAHILLKVDEGPLGPHWHAKQICEAYSIGETVIKHTVRRFVLTGMQDALHRRPQPERPEKRKINGEMEAFLIATACGPAPQGYARWSLRLLAEHYVELAPESAHITTAPGRETIRRALKKTN